MKVRWENLWVNPEAQIVTDEPLDSQAGLRKMTLRTTGIICGTCAERIQHAVEKIEGVVSARVDREADRTEVVYQGDRLDAGPAAGAGDDAVILRWARSLLAALTDGVHSGDHEDACGVRPGPGVRP